MAFESGTNNTSSILVYYHHDNATSGDKHGLPAPSPLISSHATTLTIFVFNNIIGLPLMSAGIVCNVINIVAFTRQGFKDTINVSLTSLSVSDLAFHAFTLWQTLCMIEPLRGARWPYNFGEIVIVTGSLPRLYFSRVSGVITVFIALERCVSVIKPLKVRFIFTRKRIVATELVIYLLNTLPFVLSYFSIRLGWKPDPYDGNRSYVGVVVLPASRVIDPIGLSLGIFLLFATFVNTAVCSVILVWTLSKQSRWRAKMAQAQSADDRQSGRTTGTDDGSENKKNKNKRNEERTSKETKKGDTGVMSPEDTAGEQVGGTGNKTRGGSSMSERDKRAAKTVTFLALMYVLCYLPSVLFQIAIVLEPQFSRRGRYSNAYLVFGVLGYRAEGVCASANIVVYYNTSVRFRESVQSLLFSCSRKKKTMN